MDTQSHIYFDRPSRSLVLLDQRFLPLEERKKRCSSLDDVIESIKTLAVRGAPAIGVAAAWGCVIAVHELGQRPDWAEALANALARLRDARPTAVNLAWAVDAMQDCWRAQPGATPEQLGALWLQRAQEIQDADIAANRTMGAYGAELLADGDTVLTHCNAGALATAGYGTALGPVRAAIAQGKRIAVIADETRPVLQGARLTAYELHKEGIPVTVACDGAVGLLMKKGLVQKVIVGADRIAANGDTANKIGTYTVAVLAREHGIPFYVAAPLSTIDRATPNGDAIVIEQRDSDEVALIAGQRILPHGVPAFNFAFDCTPAALITGIITEKGVLAAPYEKSIAALFRAFCYRK